MAKSKRRKAQEADERADERYDNWLIVCNPWFRSHHRRPTSFNDDDLQDMAWWLKAIMGWDKVKGIQHKSRHNFVLVRVDLDVDIQPKLGQHNWSTFVRDATDYDHHENSKIFEYDFICYGDQSNRQWQEYYPLSRPPPHNFPILLDYPAPLWCEQRHPWGMPLIGPSAAVADALAHVPGLMQTSDLHYQAPGSPTAKAPMQFNSKDLPLGLQKLSTSIPQMDLHTHLPTRQPGQHPGPFPTAFRPYEAPVHHPSHRLTLADNGAVPPYVWNHDSPTSSSSYVSCQDSKIPSASEPMKTVHSSVENALPPKLTCPDSESKFEELQTDITNAGMGLVKPERSEISHCVPWLADSGPIMTQLVSIKNPIGVKWPQDHALPDVSGVWGWLELVADGALAVYSSRARAPVPNEEQLIVRLRGDVNLFGVLGRHVWHQILIECPPNMLNEVSTVVPCSLDPETQALDRICAPEPEENYKRFRFPYPHPLPLLKQEDKTAVKVKTEVSKNRHRDDNAEGLRKRIKLEAKVLS